MSFKDTLDALTDAYGDVVETTKDAKLEAAREKEKVALVAFGALLLLVVVVKS